MTIKQLRYIVAVADNQFNISYTAERLFTSQPGISRQIKQLEDSLGCDIFVRNGKALQGLTEKGEALLQQARVVLTEYNNLLQVASAKSEADQFSIASTATQSNYVLPDVLRQFHQQFPALTLNIQDGNMDQLIDIAKNRQADCIIISGVNDLLERRWFPNMLMIPCFEWSQVLVCPETHVLAKKSTITLADLASTPIITYPPSKRIPSAVEACLAEAELRIDILATSNDPKTIKHYVTSGMGVGILAPMAFDGQLDKGLVAIPLDNILPKCTTIIALERHNMLKPHVYQFIKLYAPHLSNTDIECAIRHEGDIEYGMQPLPDQGGTWVI